MKCKCCPNKAENGKDLCWDCQAGLDEHNSFMAEQKRFEERCR